MQIARYLTTIILLYPLFTLPCLAGDIDRQILIAIKPSDILLSPPSIKDSIQDVAISSPALKTTLENAGVKEIEYALPEHVTVSPQYKIPPAGRQRPNVDGYFFLTFSCQEDRDSALEILKNNTDIYLASKRTPLQCHAVIPNDSIFWQQWGLKNVGQAGGSYNTDINAPEAWEITTGDPNVILGVVDGGVFTDHPDLMARTWLGNETFFDQHGSGVAGIMAASTNNGRGIAGVDWQCQIFAGYASTGEPLGIDETKAYYCIVGAVDAGASAINTSFGWLEDKPLLRVAYRYALNNGVAMVVSMGNEYTAQPIYPAVFTGQGHIAVGAMTNDRGKSPFSSYGAHMDVIAPGGENPVFTDANDIKSLWFWVGSNNPDYHWWSGTSFAAPHVTGTIGLLHAVHQGLCGADVESILKISAEDIEETGVGFDIYTGHGLVRADSALRILQLPNTLTHLTVNDLSIESVGSEVSHEFHVSGLIEGLFWAKLYKLSKQVDFSKEYYTGPHVWGCGSESNGWGWWEPSHGINFCDVDTSTITSTGCTVEAYVYEVWDFDDHDYVGFFPCEPSEVFVTIGLLGEELLFPPNVTADSSNPTKLVLSWDDPNNNEEEQEFYRWVAGSQDTYDPGLGAGSMEFPDTLASTPYKYWMKVANIHQIRYSDTISVKYPPRVPDNVDAEPIYADPDVLFKPAVGDPSDWVPTNKININWDHSTNQPFGTLDNYVIQQGTENCAWYPVPPDDWVWICDTTWEDMEVSPACDDTAFCRETQTLYLFRVRAVDIYGDTSIVLPTIEVTTGSLNICDSACAMKPAVPLEYELSQNWPNPFNAHTAINFSLPQDSDVKLVVYDVLGRKVRHLVDDRLPAGYHSFNWNGKDDRGRSVASGMYFYRWTAGYFNETKKMVLMK